MVENGYKAEGIRLVRSVMERGERYLAKDVNDAIFSNHKINIGPQRVSRILQDMDGVSNDREERGKKRFYYWLE